MHNLILLWLLNLISDQYSVRSNKKSYIKNMQIKKLALHSKKTFAISKPINTGFIQ